MDYIDITDNSLIYEPSAGTGNLIYNINKRFKNCRFIATEFSPITFRLLNENLKDFNFDNVETLNSCGVNNNVKKVDYSIANPPFSILPTEMDFIDKICDITSKKRLIILPSSFYFSSKFKKCFNKLIDNKQLEKILLFPKDIFLTTSIQTVCIVLNFETKQEQLELINFYKDKKYANKQMLLEETKNKIIDYKDINFDNFFIYINDLKLDIKEKTKEEIEEQTLKVFDFLQKKEYEKYSKLIPSEQEIEKKHLKNINDLTKYNNLKFSDIFDITEKGESKGQFDKELEKIDNNWIRYVRTKDIIENFKYNKHFFIKNNKSLTKNGDILLSSASIYKININTIEEDCAFDNCIVKLKIKEEYKENLNYFIFIFNNLFNIYKENLTIKSKSVVPFLDFKLLDDFLIINNFNVKEISKKFIIKELEDIKQKITEEMEEVKEELLTGRIRFSEFVN